MSRSWTQNVAAPGEPSDGPQAAGLRQIKRLQIHRLCLRDKAWQSEFGKRPGARGLAHDLKRLGFAQPRAALPTRPPAHAGTTQPSTPSSTFSGRPPTSLTTTGKPMAIISRQAKEMVSRRDDNETQVQRRQERAHIPSRPTKITRSCMPSDSTQRNWSSSGGSPAISTTIRLRSAPGNMATASSMSGQFLYAAVPALLPTTRQPVCDGGSQRSRASAFCAGVAGVK